MALQIFISWLIIFFFILTYLKYYEKKGIYYPTKEFEFNPEDFGLRYEEIYFDSLDGLRLNGWFIPAENPRGTILYCHGNAGNISHRVEIISIFNKLRLNVFIFDYRGYGKSQGSPSERGLYRDAEAAYQHLISRKDIDIDKIVLYGESVGANVAIDLAAKEKVACLISQGGFTNAYDMGKRLFFFLPLFKWIIAVKFDALTKIKNITIPKLIIHSKDDEIIPFQLCRKLFEAAVEPKELFVMRGGHNEAVFLAKEEFSLKIDSFLNRYLK